MKGIYNSPLSSNVRGFQSNQSISDINNIHTDLVIMFFDRRNQNIGKKQKECKFVLGVQFVSRKTSRKQSEQMVDFNLLFEFVLFDDTIVI